LSSYPEHPQVIQTGQCVSHPCYALYKRFYADVLYHESFYFTTTIYK